MLEKSRIVYRGELERNYHIFYALLRGAPPPLRQQLFLREPSEYHYLKSTALDAPDTDDVQNFRSAIELMTILGFSPREQVRGHPGADAASADHAGRRATSFA